MDRLIPILILIGLILAGFVIKLFELKNLIKRIDFTNDYRNKFVDFVNTLFKTKSFNQQLYYELTSEVKAMQCELGADGVFAHVIDGLKGYSTSNYQLLVNFLPELRNAINEMDNSIMSMRFSQSAGDCDDMFIRHLGSLQEYEKHVRKNLFNPFSCFSDGVKIIVALPVLLLNWLGFLSDERTKRIKNSWIIGVLNFVVVILGLIGSVVTIVLGWEQFGVMLKNFISTF